MAGKHIREALVRLPIGIAAALCITGVAYKLGFNLSSATSVHLFLVTVIALRWGFLEASVVSLLSVACLDYFFTEPLFQIYMADSRDWVALITFESVALVVSRLSNQVSQHARASELHGANLQKLYEISQGILLLDGQEPIEQQLGTLIKETFGVRGVALWNAYELRACVLGDCEVSEAQMRSIYLKEEPAGPVAETSTSRVLHSGTRAVGALVLCGHSLNDASINAIASLTAVAVERARSFSAAANAEAARQGEQLRSAILDGLAHAFKTPLTTIQTCSSGLIELDRLSGTEKRLVNLIDGEAGRLNDLTTRVLRTARADTSTLRPKRERLDVVNFVEETIREFAPQLDQQTIVFHANSHLKYLWADEQLLKLALSQIFDNAAKYGSPGSAITIDILEEEAEILLSVHNEGSFIPEHEQEKIFRRFYRSPGSNLKAPGTGIGLSVVKRVTESHHGRAWVSSDRQAGTTFFLSLPRTGNEEQA